MVDIDTVTDLGPFPFNDTFPDLPPGVTSVNHPAHEQYDDDGTVWACAWFYVPMNGGKLDPR